MSELIMRQIPTMYSVELPATEKVPGGFVNLAAVRDIQITQDKKTIAVSWIDGSLPSRYHGVQAQAILNAVQYLADLAEPLGVSE